MQRSRKIKGGEQSVNQNELKTNTDVRIRDQDIWTVIITVFHMFEAVSRELEDVKKKKKDPSLTSRDEDCSVWDQNILDEINIRLDVVEE